MGGSAELRFLLELGPTVRPSAPFHGSSFCALGSSPDEGRGSLTVHVDSELTGADTRNSHQVIQPSLRDDGYHWKEGIPRREVLDELAHAQRQFESLIAAKGAIQKALAARGRH